jgi:hypothetical protein
VAYCRIVEAGLCAGKDGAMLQECAAMALLAIGLYIMINALH